MFEQSILVRQRTSKPWSVLLSLTAELAGIGLLVVLPLIWAERLPALSLTKIAVWLPLAPAPTPVHPAPTGRHVKPSPFVPTRVIYAPSAVPPRINFFNDPPPQPTGFEPFVSGGQKTGIALTDLVARTPGPPGPPVVKHTANLTPPAPPIRIRVSHLESATVLYKVIPVYPALARSTHISGTVYLLGVIGTDGSIQSLRVLRGHPFLVRAALDAVRQWRYKPTILNGQAVEVEAPIDVTFTLQ
ncbi:MAG: energy transducer TonB [Bryobacteraceae bacterium]|jgi:protein TonB